VCSLRHQVDIPQLSDRRWSTGRHVLKNVWTITVRGCRTVWYPSTWSAFRRPVRTNNDVEGWHYRLKRRARYSHLPLYVLICLLHDEAQVCELHLKLVSDRKLTKTQKKKYKELHSQVNFFWDDFGSCAKSAKKNCYAPALSFMALQSRLETVTVWLCRHCIILRTVQFVNWVVQVLLLNVLTVVFLCFTFWLSPFSLAFLCSQLQ